MNESLSTKYIEVQGVEPRQRPGNKFGLAGCPRRCDRRDNAAARPRDLFVACPLQPQFELMRAVSAENQMGMTIHQSGRDPPPAAIDPFGRIGARWKVGTAACEGDAAVARGDQAILEHRDHVHVDVSD